MTDRERELLTEVARLRALADSLANDLSALRIDHFALDHEHAALVAERAKEVASGRRLIAMLVRRIGQGEVVHFYDKDFLEIGDYELSAADEMTPLGRAITLRVSKK
jgi:hypothetical protein